MKITLNDGTVIENLTQNGDCFVSEDEIDSSIFTSDALSSVTIIDDDGNESVLSDATIRMCEQSKLDNLWWLVIQEKNVFEKLQDSQTATDTTIQEAIVELYEMLV